MARRHTSRCPELDKGSLMNNLGIRCYVFGKDARSEAKSNGRSIRKPRNAAPCVRIVVVSNF